MVLKQYSVFIDMGHPNSYLTTFGGWKFYKIKAKGRMTNVNIKKTCAKAGLVATCSGVVGRTCGTFRKTEDFIQRLHCTVTSLADCSNPMIEISQFHFLLPH